jgi:hypothetical protein
MVRNMFVRFGRHVEVEVRYKTLEMEFPKKALTPKVLRGQILAFAILGMLL